MREVVAERGNEKDWFNLVRSLSEHAEWEETIETIKQARNAGVIKSDPARGFFALTAGYVFLSMNRFDAGVAELGSALSTNDLPRYAIQFARTLRSEAFLKLEQWNDVIAEATQLLEDPKLENDFYQSCLNFRATALVAMHRPAEAIRDLTLIIESCDTPTHRSLSTLVLRGALFTMLGEIDEALVDFHQVAMSSQSSAGDKSSSLKFYAALLMLKSRWQEGLQSLDCALQVSQKATRDDDNQIVAIIGNILHSFQSDKGWRPLVAQLVGIYSKHESLSVLGDNLVRSLSTTTKSNLNETGLDAWVALWRELGAPHDELTVPLRLLETGVAYLKTKDEGVLFDLPKEERSILRQTLALPLETAET